MQVLTKDMRTNFIKLRVDTLDDLWHLQNIIQSGDVVGALTERRDSSATDKIREKRGEKKKVYLKVRVESMDWHAFSDMLRITGTIVEGMDTGSHHTLNIKDDSELAIIKPNWHKVHLEQIDTAVKESKRPLITFISLDDENATIAVLRQYGLQKMANIPSYKSGKMYEGGSGLKGYFQEILIQLQNFSQGEILVIIGPGFVKDDFATFLKNSRPELATNLHIHPASQADLAGIHEVMKTVTSEILQQTRVSEEERMVEALLTEIKSGNKFAFGPKDVKKALESGACETLLVLDELVKQDVNKPLLELARDTGTKVHIISSLHEGGKQLNSLGGMGAILRYEI